MSLPDSGESRPWGEHSVRTQLYLHGEPHSRAEGDDDGAPGAVFVDWTRRNAPGELHGGCASENAVHVRRLG